MLPFAPEKFISLSIIGETDQWRIRSSMLNRAITGVEKLIVCDLVCVCECVCVCVCVCIVCVCDEYSLVGQ